MWQKRKPYTLLVGMQISTTTIEISMENPQNASDRTSIWSSDTPLRIYPEEHNSGSNRDTCTTMCITALSIIAKLWKQLKCPTPKALPLESHLHSICSAYFGNGILRVIYPAGVKSWSTWSQPPMWLGLQVSATVSQLCQRLLYEKSLGSLLSQDSGELSPWHSFNHGEPSRYPESAEVKPHVGPYCAVQLCGKLWHPPHDACVLVCRMQEIWGHRGLYGDFKGYPGWSSSTQ
jgi:hypothetical protein